jgi:hypothetical protein
LSYGYFLMDSLKYPLDNKSNYNITDYLLIQKSLLRINIFYDNLSYDYSTESPSLNLMNYLLDLGYTFGLFFGIF